MKATFDATYKKGLLRRRGAPIYIGHPDALSATLTCHDWIGLGGTPWNQGHIRKGAAEKKGKHVGHWAIKVVKEGEDRFEVNRRLAP